MAAAVMKTDFGEGLPEEAVMADARGGRAWRNLYRVLGPDLLVCPVLSEPPEPVPSGRVPAGRRLPGGLVDR
ncbi:MAG: hypothetical protein M3024_01355 [Candidatus Dormibacteraeota bacterium]|nr:hypothetical protein [Candidatus Dormibacteraeota bacterium]